MPEIWDILSDFKKRVNFSQFQAIWIDFCRFQVLLLGRFSACSISVQHDFVTEIREFQLSILGQTSYYYVNRIFMLALIFYACLYTWTVAVIFVYDAIYGEPEMSKKSRTTTTITQNWNQRKKVWEFYWTLSMSPVHVWIGRSMPYTVGSFLLWQHRWFLTEPWLNRFDHIYFGKVKDGVKWFVYSFP